MLVEAWFLKAPLYIHFTLGNMSKEIVLLIESSPDRCFAPFVFLPPSTGHQKSSHSPPSNTQSGDDDGQLVLNIHVYF